MVEPREKAAGMGNSDHYIRVMKVAEKHNGRYRTRLRYEGKS
jgi:hypothetical protein